MTPPNLNTTITPRKLTVLPTLLLVLFSFGVQAQSAREYQVKAVFIYNFTRFTDWPPQSFESNAPFVIGILGEDPFGEYIDKTVAGETVQGHPMVIRRYRSADEVKNCHILFISKSQDVKNALAALSNKNTLTVSDCEDFMKMGGMIRLITKENKIKLQVNPAAVNASGISISSRLLRVAEIWRQ